MTVQERDQQNATQRVEPDTGLVAVFCRLFYGAVGFGATLIVCTFLNVDPEPTKEVCILNAGVAYYTHEAAGRVVVALNRVYNVISRSNPDADK